MSEDAELERIRRKRLEKMQKTFSTKQQQTQAGTTKLEPAKVLQGVFVGRAWEVYHAAIQQYPGIAERVFLELAQLVQNGTIKGQITGEQLYGLLHQIGMDVRLETKIQYLERGELKPIADKFRGD